MIDRLNRLPRALPNVRTAAIRVCGAVAATAAVAFVAVSCKGLTDVPASLPTLASDSSVVYAINGAPPGAPTSLYFYSGTLLAADATFIFDLAFDLNHGGSVTIFPQRAVASGLTATHTVGLQTTTQAYSDVVSAPRDGYRPDTALVVGVNQTILAQSQDPNVCGLSITGSTIHAKLVVTAVDTVAKTMTIKYTVDPNCGFRSFASGIPKD